MSSERKFLGEMLSLKPIKMLSNFIKTQIKTKDVEFEILPTPVKSASDKKEYRVIRLRNGLTACLISDSSPIPDSDNEYESSEESAEDESEESGSEGLESDADDDTPTQKMAAASLCIGVGSFSDPKNIPGMAHFLEHMVFMGSKKFPEENDFDSFISKRGGCSNASTDFESTTFYFECLEKDLLAALDKFAQFFISPLMKRESITREREAIESEFQMAMPMDSNRKEQLLLSFACSESPVNSFSWGNLITLRDNVSEDDLYAGVHEFRRRHYSAHRMTLAVQGRLPLNKLQSYVLECFDDVPSNDLPSEDFTHFKDIFVTPKFTKMYYVETVNDILQVDLSWILPSLLHKYRSKPHDYVSWIIGHEGKGSLLSYLRKKVWALGISAGTGDSGSEINSLYTLFTITVTLTKEGFEHLFEIIEIIFSYVNMLRKLGPQKRLYDEVKIISDTAFKFATEERPSDNVETISEEMQIFPPEDYLTGSELFYEYDIEGIELVLNSLVPEKMNLMVLKNTPPVGLSFDQTEKWFGTKYREQDFPEQWLKKWQQAAPLDEFALPLPNLFLTKDFTILPESRNHPAYPQKILSTDIIELWYRKDEKFKLPNAFYNFHLINPMAIKNPRMSALLDIFMNLLQVSLAEETYPAQVAQLSFSFHNDDRGVVMAVYGYNEKLHILIDLIAKHFADLKTKLNEEMFKAVKDKLIQYYYNVVLKPKNLNKDVRLHILINDYRSLTDKYNDILSISFEELKKFSEQLLKNLYIKVLVQGNVTSDHATNVVNNFVETLKCKPIQAGTHPQFQVYEMPKGQSVCLVESYNKSDSNSVVTNYYQTGPFSLRDSVTIEILMLILEEPLFDTLRTKEQLGYHVGCSNRDTFGILGFSLTVNAQATKHTTEYVDSRIEEFVKETTNKFGETSKESFDDIKNDLIKTKKVEDIHLKEEFIRNWTEICEDDYMFDRIAQEIAEIQKLTFKSVHKWWKKYTSAGSDLRKLSIQVVGFKDTSKGTAEKVDNIDKKLQLKFLNCDANSIKNKDVKQWFVMDINVFKEKLQKYPVICINPAKKK